MGEKVRVRGKKAFLASINKNQMNANERGFFLSVFHCG
jgi:hypothetical protein